MSVWVHTWVSLLSGCVTESCEFTAYAEPEPTPAMMVTRTCSLTVNGPGLRARPKTLTRGTNLAHKRPTGNEMSRATICGNGNQRGPFDGQGLAYASNADRRIAEEEELVHAGDDHCPDHADDPCTKSGGGHVEIVGVGDGRADLRVGRILLCKNRCIRMILGDDADVMDLPKAAASLSRFGSSKSTTGRTCCAADVGCATRQRVYRCTKRVRLHTALLGVLLVARGGADAVLIVTDG